MDLSEALEGPKGTLDLWLEDYSEDEIRAAILALVGNPKRTLRDWYAGMALQGLCGNSGGPFQANGLNGWGIVNCSHEDVANRAYILADAMLKARES